MPSRDLRAISSSRKYPRVREVTISPRLSVGALRAAIDLSPGRRACACSLRPPSFDCAHNRGGGKHGPPTSYPARFHRAAARRGAPGRAGPRRTRRSEATPSLLLIGRSGFGKSLLASAIARAYADAPKSDTTKRPTAFVRVMGGGRITTVLLEALAKLRPATCSLSTRRTPSIVKTRSCST